MMTRYRITISIFIILLFVLPLTMCVNNRESNQKVQQAMIPFSHFRYARQLRFEFQMVVDGERRITSNFRVNQIISLGSPYFDPFYTELVFVHTEEEAIGFPDNIIVAWPRDRFTAEGVVAGFHWAVNRSEEELRGSREVITLEQFGLSPPLTVEDLVDSWERVNYLWGHLTDFEQHAIHSSSVVGPDAFSINH